MGIGGSEIFLVLFVVLLLFGSKKIPEVAKGLGKGMREFKRATDEIKREINNAEVVKDVNKIGNDLKSGIDDIGISKDINEIKNNLLP
ncbi:MAG: twin-arginine translocase TatA/TatE family subunit [Bacteroidales bacterium]